MSRIDELIAELCPNGVEYVKLNTICSIYDGTHQTPNYTTSGVQFVSVENICDLYATEKYISEEDFNKYKIKPQINDVLMTRIGTIGTCAVVDRNTPLAYYVSLALLRPNNDVLNSKYLKYYIESKYGRKELFKRTLVNAVPIKVNMGDIGKILIAVPPIEVQSEIVKVLDNFTELTAELEKELATRKKQYEYYRDKLLDFTVPPPQTSECEWRTLEDIIVSLKTGLNPRQNFSLNENGSNLPYITGKDIYDNTINVTERTDKITADALTLINKRANLENGLLLFASTGTGTVGRMAIIQQYNYDWGISETLYAIKVNESIVLTRFLMHYLYSASAKRQFEPKISKGSVPHLKVKDLEDVRVPVISIDEQTRIVSILDRFDKLCNDISEGLPAEIDARRKQYEYYRDKLLSFEEMKV